MVEAKLNYLAPMGERPFYYQYMPPDGKWRNTHGDARELAIEDARDLDRPPSLDREGFALVPIETEVADLFDAQAVEATYYREVQELVEKHTGARRVVAFDFNLRRGQTNSDEVGPEDGVQIPVRFVHNDYTLASGPQRVRDLMGDEAEALIARRFAVINVWKPIGRPVEEAPLGFCDASSMRQDDFVATDLRYRDRVGEIYSLYHRPEHRWFYYSGMRPDEALLLKCYDSATDRARFTAHSAFDDPTSPGGAPARQSIEVRTLAFF